MNLTELKVPKNLRCPVCGLSFDNASAVRSAPRAQFVIGTVTVCSGCSVPSRLTPDGMKRMTDDEINKLSPESKQTIMLTKLAIVRILEKNKKPVDIKSN